MGKMNFEEWEKFVPDSIKNDSLWNFSVYPKALWLSDLAWGDCEKILKNKLGRSLADQLLRSAGSVPANIEEGFGRGFGKDYARFLKIALGSARETRGWYYRCRFLLADDILERRYKLLDEIVALLVTNFNKQRKW